MKEKDLSQFKDSKSTTNDLEMFIGNYEPDSPDPLSVQHFRCGLANALTHVEEQQTDKILSCLAVIFTDYKNAGFENSAQVTKFIMNEIEILVK